MRRDEEPPEDLPFDARRFYRYLRIGAGCALAAGAVSAVATGYLVATAAYPFEQAADFSLGRKVVEVVTFAFTGAALGFVFGLLGYVAARKLRGGD